MYVLSLPVQCRFVVILLSVWIGCDIGLVGMNVIDMNGITLQSQREKIPSLVSSPRLVASVSHTAEPTPNRAIFVLSDCLHAVLGSASILYFIVHRCLELQGLIKQTAFYNSYSNGSPCNI